MSDDVAAGAWPRPSTWPALAEDEVHVWRVALGRIVSRQTRFPTKRPDFPRVSSATSGFFFCGIRLDPVV